LPGQLQVGVVVRPKVYDGHDLEPTTSQVVDHDAGVMTRTSVVAGRERAVRDRLVDRHPLLCFTVPAVAVTWAVQLTFLALRWPMFPALLLEIVVLVGTATTVTALTSGRAGVRSLFAGVVRWRFGAKWYLFALTAMPAATLVVAAGTGTLDVSSGELVGATVQYLFLTVVFGALLGNMWEELAWTGFLQRRLMDERGLVVGSLLTAVPFGLIHLPLAFAEHGLGGTSLGTVLLDWGLLLFAAPFFRLLLGIVYTRTGRSLLSVALVHGSFNACSSSILVEGGWQYIPAAILVAVAVIAGWWSSPEGPSTTPGRRAPRRRRPRVPRRSRPAPGAR
jgi:membrane protease YdiL (CAAX protease family)